MAGTLVTMLNDAVLTTHSILTKQKHNNIKQ